MNILRPSNALNKISKRYPDAWELVEAKIKAKGKEISDWPKWCFLPWSHWSEAMQIAVRASHSINNGDLIDVHHILETAYLSMIGTWRYTQSVYRFDEELFNALEQTELTGNLPVEVFLRLPEFCIYVETPTVKFKGHKMYGFWVRLDIIDDCSQQIELQILCDFDTDLLPLNLPIGNWTLKEGISKVFRFGADKSKVEYMQSSCHSLVKPIVSMILYLCSDEPDITNDKEPGKPKNQVNFVKTRRGGFRLFPPDKVRIWQIGKETGKVLRQSRQFEPTNDNKMRPHIRRQHWHGYWTGSRKGERHFKYNWLPAIFVVGAHSDNYSQSMEQNCAANG